MALAAVIGITLIACCWIAINKICPYCPLVQAAEKGDWKQVQRLVEAGEDVNQTDERDHTALMFACYYRNKSIVRLLIKKGARIDMTDNIGCDASAWAHTNGRTTPEIDAILESKP